MKSLLQQLENNEAVLLMYLADELPAEDRLEVEQHLAGDANFRRELDRASHPAVTESAALRQANRVVRAEIARRSLLPKPVATPRGLRYPWWSYPLATAASVLIAFLVWWGNHTEHGGQQFGKTGPAPIEQPAPLAMEPDQPIVPGDSDGDGMRASEPDRQLAALAHPSDPVDNIIPF